MMFSVIINKFCNQVFRYISTKIAEIFTPDFSEGSFNTKSAYGIHKTLSMTRNTIINNYFFWEDFAILCHIENTFLHLYWTEQLSDLKRKIVVVPFFFKRLSTTVLVKAKSCHYSNGISKKMSDHYYVSQNNGGNTGLCWNVMTGVHFYNFVSGFLSNPNGRLHQTLLWFSISLASGVYHYKLDTCVWVMYI